MANSVDPDQTAPAVCSESTLFAYILNSLVMLGNYLQQTTSADNIFRCIFLGAFRVNEASVGKHCWHRSRESSLILVHTGYVQIKICLKNAGEDINRLLFQLCFDRYSIGTRIYS